MTRDQLKKLERDLWAAANEESLYRQLAATQTTLVSVGHRSSIVKYHRQVLELCGEGEWQVHPAEGYDFRH